MLLIIVVLALVSCCFADCPHLNIIQPFQFSWVYSCPPGGFKYNYTGAALFLTGDSVRANLPALLYDGACDGNDSFSPQNQPQYASFIVDLGLDIDLSTITFANMWKNENINANPIATVNNACVGSTYAVWSTNPGYYTANFFVKVLYHDVGKITKIAYKVTNWNSEGCN